MGFAEEFAQATSRAPKAAGTKTETPAATDPSAEDPTAMFNNGLGMDESEAIPELPTGGKTEEETQPPVEAKPAKFRIAGKEFATQEEAFAYAEQLALTKLQDEAYETGKKDAVEALTPKEQQQVKTFIDEVEEEIFVNPKAALEKLKNGIEQIIEKKYEEKETKKLVEQQRKEATEKIYKDFYTENPDIADYAEIVEFVTQKFWSEVGPMPLKDGLKRVAEETRKILKLTRENSAPQKELVTKKAVVAGAGANKAPAPTLESTAQSPIDFISQVNKHRKRA